MSLYDDHELALMYAAGILLADMCPLGSPMELLVASQKLKEF
jgi:hypothetical protein